MSAELENDDPLPGQATPRPPSVKQLSKTPSWIMLGFVLGAVFVLSLPRRSAESAEGREDISEALPSSAFAHQSPTALMHRSPAAGLRQESDFTALEAVFSEWHSHAVWDGDVTEIALWDSEVGQYARFYEVLRALAGTGDSGGAGGAITFYYRSIPSLTRPVLTRGVSASAPLLFTEPDVLKEAWLRQRNEETWSAIQDSIRNLSAPRDNR